MRILLLLLFCSLAANMSSAQKVNKYPIAPKDSTVNVYFSTVISDPYQWMEDPNDSRLSDWLAEQKKITRRHGSQQVKKHVLSEQIGTMYQYVERRNNENLIPKSKANNNNYEFKFESREYSRTPDLLYRRVGATNYRYLVRIKNFTKEKGDLVIISKKIVNPEQTKIVIELSVNGSDWREAYFFDLETGKQLQDTIKFLRAGSNIVWHGEGVYYDRFQKPLEGRERLDKAVGQSLYYHKLGTPQSEDRVIYQNPDPTGTNYFSFTKIDSSRLFFNHIYASRGSIYRALSFAELSEDPSFFLKSFLIFPNNDSIKFRVDAAFEDTFILYTNWDAPNGKVLKANINKLNSIESLVPELDAPLRNSSKLGKDKIACLYRLDGQYMILIYSLDGELLKSIDFPTGKTVKYFYENDPDEEHTLFCLSSFIHPDIWYQLSLSELTFKPIETVWVPYKPNDLETRYVKYKSKDGTEIPMYITCLKKTKLNGSNPTLIYGYGGYGKTVEPYFDESMAIWLLHGGILATPSIRGGGYEGSEWVESGRRLNKQNSIDDLISAAEFLISQKYTSPSKLAISGGSHGGLMVGATITQRPELFKAAIAEAGIFDMLRFENFTVGSTLTNLSEFGSVSDYNEFVNLYSYSPLHKIKEGVEYPNLLLITGDSDDRVPPLHSYKFLATLQERGNPKSLYHLYLIPGAGHSGALTPTTWVDITLYKYYFLFSQLGLKFW